MIPDSPPQPPTLISPKLDQFQSTSLYSLSEKRSQQQRARPIQQTQQYRDYINWKIRMDGARNNINARRRQKYAKLTRADKDRINIKRRERYARLTPEERAMINAKRRKKAHAKASSANGVERIPKRQNGSVELSSDDTVDGNLQQEEIVASLPPKVDLQYQNIHDSLSPETNLEHRHMDAILSSETIPHQQQTVASLPLKPNSTQHSVNDELSYMDKKEQESNPQIVDGASRYHPAKVNSEVNPQAVSTTSQGHEIYFTNVVGV